VSKQFPDFASASVVSSRQALRGLLRLATARILHLFDRCASYLRHPIAENAMLRQQLIILNRQVKRPKLSYGDRIRLVLLARCTQFWQNALHIVQPDTLLRWHRDLFRFYWRWKSSRTKRRRQYIPQ
jgi:hypothetical protein